MAYYSESAQRHAPLYVRVAEALHTLALRREARRSTQELSRLNDHMLNDIGVTRADIPCAIDAATRVEIDGLRSRAAL
ncbi:MAG: DUF1127 domain-containing protein [Pseudomonadota bacterium]